MATHKPPHKDIDGFGGVMKGMLLGIDRMSSPAGESQAEPKGESRPFTKTLHRKATTARQMQPEAFSSFFFQPDAGDLRDCYSAGPFSSPSQPRGETRHRLWTGKPLVQDSRETAAMGDCYGAGFYTGDDESSNCFGSDDELPRVMENCGKDELDA
eukprot:CAMPEP_0196750318 /NCGR_PEP_ID=MMETSP1091-20130531/80148_1 /TAXON_ID=302021 /ORGANISM="Rhodomonas sp., Strain CCMP768" /LENGTH=155 /DNA_ID=CAMNT_0042097925 /DNA_START=145 /DNA_END=612 /DNA_ORIENTATION=+